MTSHDVVDLVRKRFAIEKVGHAGTLDPMATGVLVMLIGGFTKRSMLFASDDKDYEGTLLLGSTSDTQDVCGRMTRSQGEVNFTNEEIRGVFNKFLGEIEQRVPMYSAVKFKGRKLYELARRGVSVKVPSRMVRIKKIEVTKISLPQVSFRLTCTKGTYVRQLASDIGDALGSGACLSSLRRTRSGSFTIDEALTMEDLNRLSRSDLEDKIKRS